MWRLFVLSSFVALFALTEPAAGAEVAAMRVPGGGVYPQVQTDSRGRVHLIYFKGDAMRGDIFYVRSDNGGRSFTPAIRVNSQPNSAAIIGIVRGPHLALGKDDRVHVAWMGSDKAEPRAPGNAIPMLYTRLNDAGDAFEPQRNVIQNHPGLDGGGSVGADREGNVYVAWHSPASAPANQKHGGHEPQQQQRHDEPRHEHGKHQLPANHGSDEEDRQVWIARSRDGGKTFDPETPAFEKKLGVCACCGMRIFAADDGRVFVVFRSAHEKVNRDIHVLASNDFGKTFSDVVVDPWKIGVCVMSTASFTRDGDNVLAAWETEEQVRVGRFGANGKAATPTSVPGAGTKRKHPAIAVNQRGEYLVAWTEGTTWGKGGSLVWQVFAADGKQMPNGAGRADDLPPWSIPAAFVAPDGGFGVLY